jgi:hypothetical protein
VMALLGVNTIAELGPEYLHFTDNLLKPATPGRPGLKVVEGAKAAGEN